MLKPRALMQLLVCAMYAGIMYSCWDDYTMTWSCVRPSVCPIMRPQPRRAVGLRLNTVCTLPAAPLHWSQHGTNSSS